jgi:mono/diheme cytochrome c family protein
MSGSCRQLSLLVIAAALLTGGLARAEDLDANKSGAQLFAAGCTTCHHSPKGLTKDRFSLTLWLYLQQHYTTSSASAAKLTSYLESVDSGAKPQPAAGTRSRGQRASAIAAPGGALRPPLPVPH